jgi:hypothetical protein
MDSNVTRPQKSKHDSLKLLHQNDQDLAGIVIDLDDPVNLDDVPSRKKNNHPRFISYYFWSGKVRYVEYDEHGKILNDYWPVQYTPPTKSTWDRVDFSYGSDPNFDRHQDPRE